MKHSTGVTYMGVSKSTGYQRYKVFIDYVKSLAMNTDKKIGIICSTDVVQISWQFKDLPQDCLTRLRVLEHYGQHDLWYFTESFFKEGIDTLVFEDLLFPHEDLETVSRVLKANIVVF